MDIQAHVYRFVNHDVVFFLRINSSICQNADQKKKNLKTCSFLLVGHVLFLRSALNLVFECVLRTTLSKSKVMLGAGAVKFDSRSGLKAKSEQKQCIS